MWIGEQITARGVGNGISLIIFAGIVSRLPDGLKIIFQYLQAGTVNLLNVILFAAIALAMIVFVIIISQGIRKIPVQYAKRVVGRKAYGGHTSYIPLKSQPGWRYSYHLRFFSVDVSCDYRSVCRRSLG